MIAKVLIDNASKDLNKVYDYLLKKEDESTDLLGKRVLINFGNGKGRSVEGIIVKVVNESIDQSLKRNPKLKTIEEILDKESYIDSSDRILPNMSYCKNTKDRHLKAFLRYINLYGDYDNINFNSLYTIRNNTIFEKPVDVNAGYAIKDLSVFMNNEDITSEVYDND